MPATGEKRQPTLADAFINSERQSKIIPPDIVEKVRARLRVAERFSLDDKASVRIAEAIRDNPDFIWREQSYARQPHDVMWVEFNFRLFWEVVNDRAPSPHSDGSLGFLYDHDTVYTVSGTSEHHLNEILLTPLCYELHRPWLLAEKKAFAKACRIGEWQGSIPFVSPIIYERGAFLNETDKFNWAVNTFTWGRSIDYIDPAQQAALSNANTCQLLPLSPDLAKYVKLPQDMPDSAQKLKSFVYGRMFAESVADVRNAIAILLLLNRPALTRYVQSLPSHRTFIGGKSRKLLSHTVVTIDIDPRPVLQRIAAGTNSAAEGILRRWHKVRATWCHDYDAREYQRIGCVHVWEPDPDYIGIDDPVDPHHNRCAECGGHRWRRKAHERGSKVAGEVSHEYRVTSERITHA